MARRSLATLLTSFGSDIYAKECVYFKNLRIRLHSTLTWRKTVQTAIVLVQFICTDVALKMLINFTNIW